MNPTKNDITGDFLITGAASDKYREGWDRIFGKKKELPQEPEAEVADKELPSETQE